MSHTNPHLVQLQKALIPVSKMVIKFGLQCHEFKAKIQRAYIQAATELLHENEIKPTNQAIAVKTGIDRRIISEYKNNPEFSGHEPFNKMDLVIQALQKAKRAQTQLSHAQLTHLIDKIYGNHIRAKAVITELISNDIIQKQGKQYIINDTLQIHLSRQAALADEVDITTKRLFQTFYKKMFGSETSQRLNQATVLSSKIPDSKHDEINQLIDEKMRAFQKDMQTLIKEHETKVPEGTYSNVGFSQFQFDSSAQ